MTILLVTEKYQPDPDRRDGGARLVQSLKTIFADQLQILQFANQLVASDQHCFEYPHQHRDRFQQRLLNADYIANTLLSFAEDANIILFSHVSMAFALPKIRQQLHARVILFPMFLSVSYQLAGEQVPEAYVEQERRCLPWFDQIITPSFFEKQQLLSYYHVPESAIRVIPRGVDRRHITYQQKTWPAPLVFCSVGSIKPQKNTRQLLEVFAQLLAIYPQAQLKIIGPIQNEDYYQTVVDGMCSLSLRSAIEFVGYVAPEAMLNILHCCHIHLSTSHCETFGRTIFETLAAGLPNVILKQNNAAHYFLSDWPSACFVDDAEQMVRSVQTIVHDYDTYSQQAAQIGLLYDDNHLSQLVAAEITQAPVLAVSDFDGTLYHQDNPEQTRQAIEQFHRYPQRVICTARGIDDMIKECQKHKIQVDWIIGYSGAVVTDASGHTLWTQPIDHQTFGSPTPIYYGDECIQFCSMEPLPQYPVDCRRESYQGVNYYLHWQASKLHAIVRLLNHLNHQGRVRVFGDGPFDREMIHFFDGTWVNKLEEKKHEHVL